MEPALHSGDLVIAQAQDSYALNDVIVFMVQAGPQGGGSLVVHRIIGGDGENGFVVKGDNRDESDPWHPDGTDIVGRSWVSVPGVGNALLILRRPLVLAAVIGSLAAVWFLSATSKRSASTNGRQRPRGRGQRGTTAYPQVKLIDE